MFLIPVLQSVLVLNTSSCVVDSVLLLFICSPALRVTELELSLLSFVL